VNWRQRSRAESKAEPAYHLLPLTVSKSTSTSGAARSEPIASASTVRSDLTDAEAVLNIEMTTRSFVPFFLALQVPTILPSTSTAPGSPTVFQSADRYLSWTSRCSSRHCGRWTH